MSTALVKLLRHWSRVSAMESPDAYARRVVLRVLLDERRRPWRREAAWPRCLIPRSRPLPPTARRTG
ncbi:hypothetical protein ABZ403_15930 [Micromonospora zamorensis]|uniref:hypothetical protein n=1 Tax=Micromonospora zamorensis TaxID=709883 RepID=UPI0033E14E0E